MASTHEKVMTLPVLLGVKDDLEKAFQIQFSSLGEKFQKMKKQWEDLVLRVEVLEGELKSSKEEVGYLRSDLIVEKECRKEGEESNQKLMEVIEQLQRECVRLEEKIAEFEERPTAPPPPDNGVLNILNELVSDTTSNFERWNGRQVKLEEKVERIEEVMGPLLVRAPPTPPPPAPVSSAVIENCFVQTIPEKETTPTLDRSPNLPNPEKPRITKNRQIVSSSVRKPRHGVDPADPSGKFCLCGSSFSCKANLRDHIFYFTQEWQFPCQFCKMRFVGYTKLRQHLRVVHDVAAIPGEEKRIGCRHCGALLRTQLQYRKHFKLVHGQEEDSVNERKSRTNAVQQSRGKGRPPVLDARHGKDRARYLHCLCGRMFSRSSKLTNHVRYFNKKKTFQCRICDKGYAYNGHLKAHMARVHSRQFSSHDATK